MGFSKEKTRLVMANKCMSIADVTRRAGLANTTLYKIMAVDSNIQPSLKTIGRISKALGVAVQDLITE